MKRIFFLLLVACLLFFGFTPADSAQSIKPGTEIRVRLIDRLDTGQAQPGQEFSATLAEPVRLENGTEWPRGTEVKGRIVDVVSSGRLRRPASITLQLTQIANSAINTETERIDGRSHAGRNAALIGGGAAFGAILGAITGGAKGAAIGSAVGAGAGTATAAATGKQEIVLPAETPIVFVIAGADAAQAEPNVSEVSSSAPEPVANQTQDAYANSGYYEPYSPNQLDNLVAPVALYPDPLLAQLLVAATFPDQIQDASGWVRANNPYYIDDQPWDVSVKAVAHYPTVLNMMNDRLDWTIALGQAYANQSTDVMMSVQRLRNMAYAQGNLITTPQQQVIVDRGYIQIVPAQPRWIYVPVYDPGVIFVRHVYRPGLGFGGFFRFGRGFVIGAWLNYDMDWHSRRIVYEGWRDHDRGWRGRSRPYVHITNIYVNNRYEHIRVNQAVLDRHVDYDNVRRYKSVHRDVNYDNRARAESRRFRNQPPRGAEQQRWHSFNVRENRGGYDRGDHNRPAVQEEPQRQQRPDNGRFERTNQTPRNMQQSRPLPSFERTNDRGNARGNRNRPSVRKEPPQQQNPGNGRFERTNQIPTNREQPRSQPAVGRMTDRGNGNHPEARHEQPVSAAPPHASRGAEAASPAVMHSSTAHSKARPQGQQERQHTTNDKGKRQKESKSR